MKFTIAVSLQISEGLVQDIRTNWSHFVPSCFSYLLKTLLLKEHLCLARENPFPLPDAPWPRVSAGFPSETPWQESRTAFEFQAFYGRP